MANVLISWLGTEKDMLSTDKVNTEGPTWNLYKYHYQDLNIDYHKLLITTDKQELGLKFRNYAVHHFGYDIKLVPLEIDGVHWNLSKIKNEVEKILLSHKHDNVFIFFSTGSGIMKVAWYIVATTLKQNINLIQILKPEESPTGKPELIYLDFKPSSVAYSMLVRELHQIQESHLPEELILTPTLKEVYDKASIVASLPDVSVLIIGDTGTGKEELARFIHKLSPRAKHPFRAINCAAFSDELLESRLFGHAKGSFTGAYKDQKGIFEEANKGTVFLDEIGDISPYMQQALLRFMQFKEIQPIGKPPKKVDVRVIAATNKSLEQLIEQGNFRSDLFFRFSVILKLPNFSQLPPEEKKQIINSLLQKRSKIFNKPTITLCKDLYHFLITYKMPGNFRELINIIDHIYIFANKQACFEHLPPYVNLKPKTITKLEDIEAEHIKKIYHMFNKNKAQTAKALGIALNTLKTKLKKYNID